MIFINIFHLDWIAITQWIITALVFLVIFIKTLQYILRWGNVKALNLDYKYKNLKITDISNITEEKLLKGIKNQSLKYLEVKKKKEAQFDDTEEINIIIFTPYLVSIRRFIFMATAFSERNYRVILINSQDTIRLIFDLSKRENVDNLDIFTDLISYFKPQVVIGFDFIANFMINFKKSSEKILWICLRPVLDPNDLRITRRIPFTYFWFYILILIISGKIKPLRLINGYKLKSNQKSSWEVSQKIKLNNKLLLIHPQWALSSVEKIKNGLSKIKKSTFEVIHNEIITKGKFSFQNQETIVYSLINRAIDNFL